MLLLWSLSQPRHPATFPGGGSQEKSRRGMEKPRRLQRDICFFFSFKWFMMSCNPEAERRTVLLGGAFCRNKALTRADRPGFCPGSGIYWLPGPRCFTGPLWVSRSSLVEPGSWTRSPQGLPTVPLSAFNSGLWILPILPKGSVLFHVRKKIRNSSWSLLQIYSLVIELKIGKIRLKRGNIKKMGYVSAEKKKTQNQKC